MPNDILLASTVSLGVLAVWLGVELWIARKRGDVYRDDAEYWRRKATFAEANDARAVRAVRDVLRRIQGFAVSPHLEPADALLGIATICSASLPEEEEVEG